MIQKVERRVHLSLVIPVYNEERRISQSLNLILQFLDGQPFSWEIIVVDDGSHDRTVEIVRQFSEHREGFFIHRNGQNAGKGAAVRAGILQASGDYLLFTDADLSVPIGMISQFLSKLEEGYDLAIGSRAIPGAIIDERQPLYREFMGKVYTSLSTQILRLDLSDLTCGFKAFRRLAALDLFGRQRLANWSFDSELLFLAKKNNYRIVEIPVVWRNDRGTKVKLWRDVAGSFFGLIQIRLNQWKGLYR
jgi:glycosyltransferase involved in cell wall biosynthesis